VFLGKLEIIFPGYVRNQSKPILLFQVYPQGSTFKSSQSVNDQVSNQPQVNKQILNSNRVDGVKISPNPTKDKVTITTSVLYDDRALWTITNVNGQVLDTGEINATNVEVDFSVYQRGVYFIKLEGTDILESFKIIKQ